MTRLIAAFALVILPLVARAENWPQWRGPDNNGISQEKGIPAEWSETKNIAWKIPMPGLAGSTPAIWGDRIFLTSGEGREDKNAKGPKGKGKEEKKEEKKDVKDSGGKDLYVMCVKTTDGSILWKKKAATASRPSFRGDEGNEAGASPSVDGKHVYVFFGTGDLLCYDFDGNEIWKTNVQKDYGRFSIQHGMHITPLLHGDRLYVVLLTNGGHWVIALDKATGNEVWKHARKSDAKGESREAYSSPILWTTGKEPCLVVLGCDYTTAHRLTDGSEIWRLTELNPKTKYSDALRIIASPVAINSELVVPTARGGLVVAMKPGATGDVNAESPYELWRKGKGAPDVPSPLIHDGFVYLDRENGFLHCWDAATGQELYGERLYGDRYRASPVLVDGKIILPSRTGTFTVVKPGPKFEKLAENKLDDIFTASPAISGGRMYLRGFGSLYAIENKQK